MTVGFEDALREPGPRVLAWDLHPRGLERTLSVFDLAGGGATQVAWRCCPDADVAEVTRVLAARGFAVGTYDGHQPFVWHASPEAVTVWGPSARVIEARGDVLTCSLGRTLPVASIAAFAGYVDAEDHVDRGIKAELRDGSSVTVAYDLSLAASGNPTYNRNDLLSDSGWIPALGSELARWARVPYRHTF